MATDIKNSICKCENIKESIIGICQDPTTHTTNLIRIKIYEKLIREVAIIHEVQSKVY